MPLKRSVVFGDENCPSMNVSMQDWANASRLAALAAAEKLPEPKDPPTEITIFIYGFAALRAFNCAKYPAGGFHIRICYSARIAATWSRINGCESVIQVGQLLQRTVIHEVGKRKGGRSLIVTDDVLSVSQEPWKN
jgi:hypothetical protein